MVLKYEYDGAPPTEIRYDCPEMHLSNQWNYRMEYPFLNFVRLFGQAIANASVVVIIGYQLRDVQINQDERKNKLYIYVTVCR